MSESITFSTHTEFCFTFTDFFGTFYHNDSKRRDFAWRVWEKMIERVGGTECEFTDEVGFSDFKDVIVSMKMDAESDTSESDSEDEEDKKSEKSKEHDSDSD